MGCWVRRRLAHLSRFLPESTAIGGPIVTRQITDVSKQARTAESRGSCDNPSKKGVIELNLLPPNHAKIMTNFSIKNVNRT